MPKKKETEMPIIKKLSRSERAQMLYDDRQKAFWIEKDILKTVLNKRNRELIANGIKAGFTMEQISQITGLSIDEVEKQKLKIKDIN